MSQWVPWWANIAYKCRNCGSVTVIEVEVDMYSKLIFIQGEEPLSCTDCHLLVTL